MEEKCRYQWITDWVYEVCFVKAFDWSADSKIAYIRFDESEFQSFRCRLIKIYIQQWRLLNIQKLERKNAVVSLHLFDVTTNAKNSRFRKIQRFYIARMQWTKDIMYFQLSFKPSSR
jgi:hypothetical protein